VALAPPVNRRASTIPRAALATVIQTLSFARLEDAGHPWGYDFHPDLMWTGAAAR
jgi:hypothetical protein